MIYPLIVPTSVRSTHNVLNTQASALCITGNLSAHHDCINSAAHPPSIKQPFGLIYHKFTKLARSIHILIFSFLSGCNKIPPTLIHHNSSESHKRGYMHSFSIRSLLNVFLHVFILLSIVLIHPCCRLPLILIHDNLTIFA